MRIFYIPFLSVEIYKVEYQFLMTRESPDTVGHSVLGRQM